jgi:hypothetical protein
VPAATSLETSPFTLDEYNTIEKGATLSHSTDTTLGALSNMAKHAHISASKPDIWVFDRFDRV